MKLLLTASGFIGTPLEQEFIELVGDRKNLRVAIIPNASDPIEWVPEAPGSKHSVAKLTRPNDASYGKGKDYEYFTDRGYEVIIVDLKEDPEIVKEKLERVDIIEVWGGDVNWLLDLAKKAKLDTYLNDILDRNVVYAGVSAGSMLLNPDIGFTWWEPEETWDKTDHVGLGVVAFMFQPLHGETDEAAVTKLIVRKKYLQRFTPYPWNIYLVTDGQAVKVDGDSIEHIGPGVKNVI